MDEGGGLLGDQVVPEFMQSQVRFRQRISNGGDHRLEILFQQPVVGQDLADDLGIPVGRMYGAVVRLLPLGNETFQERKPPGQGRDRNDVVEQLVIFGVVVEGEQ